ncbi:hypothetical protein GOODEAATRI_030848 [Goodea atripinnis]|uniref:Uncharacterized protein n=1 Tax=Goodea atripinnis TaxID=208336 RepID=A0ABV0MWR7_9TELE
MLVHDYSFLAYGTYGSVNLANLSLPQLLYYTHLHLRVNAKVELQGVINGSMSEHEASATSEGSSSLLASMREMMEEMRGDIIGRFKTIVADVVKREDIGTLAPLENKITLFASVISNLEEAANDHEQRLAAYRARMTNCKEK